MAPKRHAFFESPKTWSRRKHRLLGKYLRPFSAKVGSWAEEIYCIDGFAGAGRYEDGSPGSPLLVAQLAEECARWQSPVSLRCINVEAVDAHFHSLCEHTKKWVERGIVTNMPGEFGELVPHVLAEIGKAPAFFFIDPFGPTHVHFSHLKPILERKQRTTELIINFDADGLRRIADTMHSRARTVSAVKTLQTNITRVMQIIGSNRWKKSFVAGNLTSYQRERELLNEYMASLSAHGYMVVAYPIRKSFDDSAKYYLVYCTRHEDGIALMNSFIRDEEDALLRDSTTSPGQLVLSQEFDAVHREVHRRRSELRELILQFLRNNRKTTRGRIRKHFIFERFGEFHDRDYNAVVQDLIREGVLGTAHGKQRINNDILLTYVL